MAKADTHPTSKRPDLDADSGDIGTDNPTANTQKPADPNWFLSNPRRRAAVMRAKRRLGTFSSKCW